MHRGERECVTGERRRREPGGGAIGGRVNSGEDIEGGDENADDHRSVDRHEQRLRIRRLSKPISPTLHHFSNLFFLLFLKSPLLQKSFVLVGISFVGFCLLLRSM